MFPEAAKSSMTFPFLMLVLPPRSKVSISSWSFSRLQLHLYYSVLKGSAGMAHCRSNLNTCERQQLPSSRLSAAANTILLATLAQELQGLV